MNVIGYNLYKEKWEVQNGGNRLFVRDLSAYEDIEEGEPDGVTNNSIVEMTVGLKGLPKVGKAVREAAKVLKQARKQLENHKKNKKECEMDEKLRIPKCDEDLYLMGEVFGFLLSGYNTAKEYYESDK